MKPYTQETRFRFLLEGLTLTVLTTIFLLPVGIVNAQVITNGMFEGGFYYDASMLAPPDSIPDSWTKTETLMHPSVEEDSSYIGPDHSDNGPSGSGGTSLYWKRWNNYAHGDWTIVDQDIDINAYCSENVILNMDIKVLYHDLGGSGKTTGNWEYPVSVRLFFTDTDGEDRILQYGWYQHLDDCGPPPDGYVTPDGSAIVYSRQVNYNQWYAESLDVLSLMRALAEPQTINRIEVGGSGWDFEGKVDNVVLDATEIPDCHDVTYGRTPLVDGFISHHEYSDAHSFSFPTSGGDCVVYLKHSIARLYVAFDVPNTDAESAVQIFVDTAHDQATEPKLDDYRFTIAMRSPPDDYGENRGMGSDWSPWGPPVGWKGAYQVFAGGWHAEFEIPYAKLGLVSGVPKEIGISFWNAWTSTGDHHRPVSAVWTDPSSWGLAYSSDKWFQNMNEQWCPYSERYAIIVMGGNVSGQMYIWYWGDTGGMYQELLSYGFTGENIYFLSYGDSAAAHPSWVDATSTTANINAAYQWAQNKCTAGDLLYVYWVDHGTSTYFNTHDGTITHAQLGTLMQPIIARQIIGAYNPCYSGAVIDDISRRGVITVTSQDAYNTNSWGWAGNWRRALRGDPADNVDTNGDGYITLTEAFDWIGPRSQAAGEHSMFDDNGDGVGHEVSDTGYNPGDAGKDGYTGRFYSLDGWRCWTPTATNLAVFTASGFEDHALIEWETSLETHNAGFNLYRSVNEGAEQVRINDRLIPARGTELSGTSYSYIDSDVISGRTYHYWLEDVDIQGVATLHGPVTVTAGSYDDTPHGIFKLAQNHPNPFNPVTEIMYELPTGCQVTLEIYNVLGQRIVTLVNGYRAAGVNRVSWDGRNEANSEVASGIYFYRITAGTFEDVKKMVLLR